MLHTKLEKWKNNYLSYLDIYTGQHMPIGINNSVLYIDYLQKVWQNKVIPFCFFHTRPQAVHLHILTQKNNVLLIKEGVC